MPVRSVISHDISSSNGWSNNYPYQRKLHYARGLYWSFYTDGPLNGGTNSMYFRTAPIGGSWSTPTLVRGGFDEGLAHRMGVWVEQTTNKVYYAFSNPITPTNLFFRQGTLNVDGTITWDAAEQGVDNPGGGFVFGYPMVVVDSNGFPWVTVMRSAAPAFSYPEQALVYKSTRTDGLWNTDVGFPIQTSLHSTGAGSHNPPFGVKLPGGKMWFTEAAQDGSGIQYEHIWDGAAMSSPLTIPNGFATNTFNQVSTDDGVVHLIGNALGALTYMSRNANGSWNSPLTVDALGGSFPTISTLADGRLRIYWETIPDAPYNDANFKVYYQDVKNNALHGSRVQLSDETAYGLPIYQSPLTGHNGIELQSIPHLPLGVPDMVSFTENAVSPFNNMQNASVVTSLHWELVKGLIDNSGSIQDTNAPIYQSTQRKIFRDSVNGLYWCLYGVNTGGGGFITLSSSPDGVYWYSANLQELVSSSFGDSGNAYSFWVQGNTLHVAMLQFGGQSVAYLNYTLLANGTASFNYQNTTAMLTDGSHSFYYPTVTVDDTGHPWISAALGATGFALPWSPIVSKSSTNDGTWVTDTGFPHTLATEAGNFGVATILPQTGGKMIAIWNSNIGDIMATPWNGSIWGADESVVTPSGNFRYGAITDGDVVVLAFPVSVPSNGMWVYRRNASGVWTSVGKIAILSDNTTVPVVTLTKVGTNKRTVRIYWSDLNKIFRVNVKIDTGSDVNTFDQPTLLADESVPTLPRNDQLQVVPYSNTLDGSMPVLMFAVTGSPGLNILSLVDPIFPAKVPIFDNSYRRRRP